MSITSTIAQKWMAAKPVVIGLAIGLLIGPFFSNFMGWQVTSGSAQAQARAGVIEQAALFCEQRARLENKDAGTLAWGARNELAKKWAVVPGSTVSDSDIVSACARKLAAT